MIKMRQLGLDSAEEVFERAKREADEQQVLYADILMQQVSTEDRLSPLIHFLVECADQTLKLIVFNTVTGQAGVISCTRPRRRFGRNPKSHEYAGELKRLSTHEAARLVSTGARRLSAASDLAGSIDYPQWMFDPTDEQIQEWRSAARLFRFEAQVYRITSLRRQMATKLVALIGMLRAIAVVAVIRYSDTQTLHSPLPGDGNNAKT